MGKGYANDNKPFDPNTACYLKPVLAAIELDHVRKVVIKAGVKTMKSFVVEMALGYYCPFGSGDCSLYFGTEEMGEDQATSRILNYLWGIPSMAEKRKTIIGQWDETMKAIKFPDKTLRISPANLMWVQELNLEFVGVRDAHVTKATGMIDQIIARTTQYPSTKKIIIESQGGENGYDFDRHYDDTDQRELHVKCPLCDALNIWNWKGWHRERPDDFQATLPRQMIAEIKNSGQCSRSQDEAIEAAQKKLTIELLKPERRDCGFKRGDEKLIRLENGEYNEREVLRQTYYECYHCGGAWFDDGEFGKTRCGLDSDDSVRYMPARSTALSCNVGFNFPQWINRRLPWGEMMLEFLKHVGTHKKFGNIEPLKQWWQKTAGRTWDGRIETNQVKGISGTYDPNMQIVNEAGRLMLVDCQMHPETKTIGHFWYVARVWDTNGNSWQLARGYATSWEEWIAVKRKFKIPNGNVGIDGGHWLKEVLQHAAMFREREDEFRRGKKIGQVWATWKVLMTNALKNSFKWEDRIWRVISQPSPWKETIVEKDGRQTKITIGVYQWSDLTCSDQLNLLWIGGANMAKFNKLDWEQLDDQTKKMESGDLAYDEQMNSEYATTVKGRRKWLESRADMNHYLTCERMGIALAALGGWVGHVAPPGDDESK